MCSENRRLAKQVVTQTQRCEASRAAELVHHLPQHALADVAQDLVGNRAGPAGVAPREDRKRLGEKRSKRKQLAKAAQPSKPAQPSIVIEDLDLEVEFTAITERVELWAAEFAQEDYLRLVRRVTTYTGELLSEAGYTDDQPAEAEVTA